MCQDGCLLDNHRGSGKALHITNVVDTHTWILLDRQSTNNVFYNGNMLDDLAHMEVYMSIQCN